MTWESAYMLLLLRLLELSIPITARDRISHQRWPGRSSLLEALESIRAQVDGGFRTAKAPHHLEKQASSYQFIERERSEFPTLSTEEFV